ncbi:hypothetical protein JAAARDRAFT_69023, partial [Jaapia argillacea MUCL 33604]
MYGSSACSLQRTCSDYAQIPIVTSTHYCASTTRTQTASRNSIGYSWPNSYGPPFSCDHIAFHQPIAEIYPLSTVKPSYLPPVPSTAPLQATLIPNRIRTPLTAVLTGHEHASLNSIRPLTFVPPTPT